MRKKVYQWFDERLHLGPMAERLLYEPIPGGARWAYIFGSALLFIFSLQLITGIFLMFYYAPTVDHAWASIRYIMEEVTWGDFIRSLHNWGSSAMVFMMVLHMLQVFVWGAYKKPRELVWLAGSVLFLCVIGLGFTGYLLPWDQRAFWATTVGIEIAGIAPFVGDFLARFLKGGASPGVLTLNRFFVIHVMILPLTVMGVAALHLFLMRKAGPAGPYQGNREELERTKESFWPKQVAIDAMFMILLFAALATLAVLWPAELGPRANPSASAFDPEPEWYFLFLFQLLRLPVFFGPWGELVGAVLLPLGFILLVVFLPFLDRSPERRPWKRPYAMGIAAALMAGILVLTVQSIQARRPTFHVNEAESRKGMVIYYTKGTCTACHMIKGLDDIVVGKLGGEVGADLTEQPNVQHPMEWHLKHFEDPASISPGSFMPPAAALGLSEDELKALVHFLNDPTKGLPQKELDALKKKVRGSQ